MEKKKKKKKNEKQGKFLKISKSRKMRFGGYSIIYIDGNIT